MSNKQQYYYVCVMKYSFTGLNNVMEEKVSVIVHDSREDAEKHCEKRKQEYNSWPQSKNGAFQVKTAIIECEQIAGKLWPREFTIDLN